MDLIYPAEESVTTSQTIATKPFGTEDLNGPQLCVIFFQRETTPRPPRATERDASLPLNTQ